MEYLWTTILLVIIVALTILHISTHYSKSGIHVNGIPGPRSWPIIGNSLDIAVSPENLWKFFRSSADKYYSIYKFWVGHWPAVNIRHPDDVEILLSSQKNISKSLFYNYLHPWLNEGLLTSTGNKWRARRKILTPAFHFNVLQEFVGVFAENSARMVETLKQEKGEIVKDVIPFMANFTLNAICETAMGTALQDNDPSVQEKYRDAVKLMGDIVYHRSMRPWLASEWVFSFTRMGREQVEALNILHGFTDKIIKSRKKYHEETGGKYLKISSSDNAETSLPDYDIPLKKKRHAMLDLLIGVQKEGENIDDLGIREECDTFIFEGHDTTDMGLSFALLLLAEHKEIQARAREEIDAVLKESNGKLGMNELQKLSYLDRCIKEVLRLFPSVPTISRVLTDDMYLKNHMVPRGTIVNVHIYDTHRDPNFWPQPEVFDPDRFLPERIKGRHPFSYVPFSAGPRNCIGQKFAMLELKIFIGLILHNFYLESMVKVSYIRANMLPDLVLKSINPLDVKFIPIRQ